MKTNMFSAPNPHYKTPRYNATCPHCGKKEVVKTWKTRKPAIKVCRGCGKEYEVPINKISYVLENQIN